MFLFLLLCIYYFYNYGVLKIKGFFSVHCVGFCIGFYLATAADDAVVKLWDLRKLSNFKTITLDNNYEVKSLKFDHSGTYLAVAGSDVR